MIQLITLDETNMIGPKPPIVPQTGVWIAGGCIRRWFNNEDKLRDVDCFFINQKCLDDFQTWLINQNFKKVDETINAITYHDGETLVQCIKVAFYTSAEALLDSFDFTVCQFAWDGKVINSTPQAIISVTRNHLGVHELTRKGVVDSLRRAFKYCKRGYHPCNGSIMKLANGLAGLTEEEIKNAVAVSPHGGASIVRID